METTSRTESPIECNRTPNTLTGVGFRSFSQTSTQPTFIVSLSKSASSIGSSRYDLLTFRSHSTFQCLLAGLGRTPPIGDPDVQSPKVPRSRWERSQGLPVEGYCRLSAIRLRVEFDPLARLSSAATGDERSDDFQRLFRWDGWRPGSYTVDKVVKRPPERLEVVG